MFHHHVLTRDKKETVHKIYNKQKEATLKGDWFDFLKEDFKFIGVKINEAEIIATPQSSYKKQIKQLMNKAVYLYFMNQKQGHTKLDGVGYTHFGMQPYLTTTQLNNEEKTVTPQKETLEN